MKYLFLAFAAFVSLAQAGIGDDLKKAGKWIEDNAKDKVEDKIKEEAEDIGDIWEDYKDKVDEIEESART